MGVSRPNDIDWEDLFQPVLTSSDDMAGFQQPWNPHTIVLIAFCAGMAAGTLLLAFNAVRLGLRHKFWPLLLGGAILLLLTDAGIYWGWLAWAGTEALQTQRGLISTLRRVMTVVAAWMASADQRQRYRLAEITHTPRGSLLVPGAGACIVGIALEYALAAAFIAARDLLPLVQGN